MIKKIKHSLAKRKALKRAYRLARASGAYNVMTLSQLIRTWLIKRIPVVKQKVSNDDISLLNSIAGRNEINHIAIVLDGVVQDVMRAQNRMTALLLSEPDFVEFDPNNGYPVIGQTRYENGRLVFEDAQ